MKEKQFMAMVVRLARLLRWTPYHTFSSRRSTPGFPDLVLRRGPGHAVRLIAAELKVGKAKPTVEQYAWLGAFQDAGIPAYVWTWPGSWEEIERTLGG